MNHRIVVFAAACRRRGLQPDTGRSPLHRAEVGDGERQTVPGVDLADAARPSLHRRQHVRGRKRAGGSQLLSQSDQLRRSSLVLHDRSANHPRILRSAQMWSVLAVFTTRARPDPTRPDRVRGLCLRPGYLGHHHHHHHVRLLEVDKRNQHGAVAQYESLIVGQYIQCWMITRIL